MTRTGRPSHPPSGPVSSRRALNLALKTAKDVLASAKSLSSQKGICITGIKSSPIFQQDATKLVQSTLPSIELSADELNQIVSMLLEQEMTFKNRLKIPLGDLAAFYRNFDQETFKGTIPSILSFYSIINLASRGGINVFVRVGREFLRVGGEEVDIQEIPGTRRRAVEVFRAVERNTALILNDNLVEAQRLFKAWLEINEQRDCDFRLCDILEQAFEQATAPNSQYPL
ncbi:MAG: hypothetical protein ABIH22_04715 [Candidatus Margulisiibacteriota bacterium]